MVGRKKAADAATGVQEVEFDKEQVLTSAKYHNQRDLVDALLDPKKKYTVETVDKMIDGFMKGKVK